jgi:serine/threonine protein phosphatase 1
VRCTIIYLGDYVDRGPDSRGVLDLVVRHRFDRVEAVHLLGNHEQSLLGFLEKPETGASWMYYGGDATLASYGIAVDPMAPRTKELLTGFAQALKQAMPAEHLAFLQSLALSYENGDYLFVHAGIDPKRPLDKQDKQDLIWIRDGFTGSAKFHGKVVVHGHTIAAEPVIRPNRIGIDTGAYVSGKLTCLVLEGAERRFLTT